MISLLFIKRSLAAAVGLLLGAACAAAEWSPVERRDQVWRITQFAAAAGAVDQNILGIAFQRDPAGAGGWVLWAATSDGLLEYDGHVWRRHRQDRGLPSSFVRAVCVTRENQLWVGTDKGAGVYDKKTFSTMGSERGLAGQNVRRIIQDSRGVVWFCSDSWPDASRRGGLASLEEGRWRAHTTADGLPSDYVVACLRDSAGTMLAVTSRGPAELRGERWEALATPEISPPGNWTSSSLVETPEGQVVLSVGPEIFTRSGDVWTKHTPQFDASYGLMVARDGAILGCAASGEGRRAFARWGKGAWSRVSAGFPVPAGHVEDLAEGPDGAVWVVGHGVITRWQREGGEWTEYSGLGAPRLVDGTGRIWFLNPAPARAGREFLASHADGKWTREEGPWLGLEEAPDGAIWGIKPDRLARWSGSTPAIHGPAETGLERIATGRVDRRGRFWAVGWNAAGEIQTSHFDGTAWKSRPLPGLSGAPSDRLAAPAGDGIWFATEQEDLAGATLVLVTPESQTTWPIPTDVLGRFGSKLAAEPGGDTLWIHGDNGLFQSGATKAAWSRVETPLGRQVLDIAWRADGMWTAHGAVLGGEAGLGHLRAGEWESHPTHRLAGMQQSRDGTLLAGFKGGFMLCPADGGHPPREVFLPKPNAAPQRVLRDAGGAYWAGDGETVFRFKPDKLPSETRITANTTELTVGGDLEARAVALPPYQNREAPYGQFFQWRLDGGEWSAPSRATITNLTTDILKPGGHRLEVRSMDAGGDVDPTPALLEFTIGPVPLQLRPWFLPSVGLVVLVVGILAATAANARRKLSRLAANLEREVAERTAELKKDIDHRREVEAALQASEERLQLALSQTGVGVWDWNPENNMLYWSEQCGQIYGVGALVQSREEYKKFVHPDDLAWVRERFDQAAATRGLYEAEFRIVRADGRERWVANLGRGAYDDQGRLLRVVGIVRDTTGERESRAMLEVQRRELQMLLDSVPAMIYHKDAEGRLLRVNAAMVRITGLSEESLIGYTDSDLGSPFADEYRERDLHVMRTGQPLLGVVEQFATLGGVRWLLTDKFPHRDSSGKVVGLLGFSLDITERKRAEDALRESEERLREVVESIHEVFWTWDLATNRFIYVSPAYEKLWGRSITELLANPARWVEAIHPEDRENFLQTAMPAGVRGECDLQYRVVRPGGEVCWMHDRAFGVRGPEGKLERVTGIAEDITVRKGIEDELRQAQKMAAIGQLSGGVAHDFNNLLTVILMHICNLEDNESLPEPVRDSVSEIRSAADRAAALTRQLLMFSRRQTLQIRSLDLNETVRGMAKLLRRLIGEHIAIDIQTHPQPLPIRADSGMIDQALMNLAVNARDAMPGGGRLTIRTSNEHISAEVASIHPGASPGQFACITVSDNGSGIPAHILPRIFEPFFTTKETGKGTGLGLATVFGILQQHRGWIMVDSAPGQGTTFRAYIPHAPRQEQKEGAAPAAGRQLPKGAESILVVEDEQQLRTLIRLILSRLGYRVIEAGSGPEALKVWGRHREEIKLLITDLVMPEGMSGFDLAAMLLRDRPDLKVLYSSGYSPELAGREIQLQDGVNFLPKPYQAAELARIVRSLLEPPAKGAT